MGDIYVVSAGARERLLAEAEQYEEHYVVRAGLEPDLLLSTAVRAHGSSPEQAAVAHRARASAAVTSGRGRE